MVGLLADADLLGRPLDRLLGAALPEIFLVTAVALVIAVLGVAMGLGARWRWPASISWPVLARVTPLFAGEFGLKILYEGVTWLGFRGVEGLGAFDRLVFDRLLGGIIQGVLAFVRACGGVDRRVFDAFAQSLATVTLAVVRAAGRVDVRRFDAAVRDLGRGILSLGQRVRCAQTGHIENYLLMALVWGLGVLLVAVLATFIR